MWVMPSSSARCAQLPRAADKVPYYAALKKFRDYLNGAISHLDESDIVFADSKLKKREIDAIEESKKFANEEIHDGDLADVIKVEPGLIPGKKKRGRPKKIKNPEDQPPPDPEKMDGTGEVVKKRRGRPKKIHQQQKLQEREVKEREQMNHMHQQHQMSHMDGYGMSNCFSPPMMSPPKPFAHMAPYSTMGDPSYFGQGLTDSPYMSAKQSPVHMQHYSQSPKSMSLPYTHSDLSSEINTAISSENNIDHTPLTSPSVEQPDFEPPSSISQQNMDHRSYNPAGNPDGVVHGSPGTTSHSSYTSYMGYHDQTPDPHSHPHQGTPTPMSQDEHSHQTPPHNHPHTPNHSSMSPHPHEHYGLKRNGAQDVASKSLSDLESLVDQIPSITDGGGQRLHGHMGEDSMADKLDQQYMNSGFNNSMNNYSPPLQSSVYSNSMQQNSPDNYSSMYGMNGRPENQGQQHSKSYSMENLVSSNYTPSMNSHPGNSYPNLIPSPHYPVPTNGYLFGGLESSLMQRTYGMGGMSGMGGMHPSLGHMTNPYPYNGSYTSSFDAYPAPPSGIHAPSANYPSYPTPVSSAPGNTTPPSYIPSHRPQVDLAYDGV